jgi:23S rRNA (guanosine2251-2'-O)-methyltransferase
MNHFKVKPNKVPQSFIFGSYPVKMALERFPSKIKEIWIQKDLKNTISKEITTIAKKNSLLFYEKEKKELDILVSRENHQGVVAFADHFIEYQAIESLKHARTVLIVDHIEDPHNLGAILRTCEQFGVDAVVIPKNRGVEVNATVIKVSSGAAFLVPVVKESSLLYVVEKLKDMGFWVYASDSHEGVPLNQITFEQKTALILGNESSGVSLQLKNKSDFKVSIPSFSKSKKGVDSLNVSVAAGVLIYGMKTQSKNLS